MERYYEHISKSHVCKYQLLCSLFWGALFGIIMALLVARGIYWGALLILVVMSPHWYSSPC
jgi:hypothetical protein